MKASAAYDALMPQNIQHLTLRVPPGGKQAIGEFRATGDMDAVVSLSGTNVPARVIEIRADTVWVTATPGGTKFYAGIEQRLRIVATLNAPAGTAGGVIGVNVCANVTGPWESCECAYKSPLLKIVEPQGS